jgi:hypothetical protein
MAAKNKGRMQNVTQYITIGDQWCGTGQVAVPRLTGTRTYTLKQVTVTGGKMR